METNKIYLGDCLESMKLLPDNSVDAIVTDPPYGLSFMGKKRDYDVPSQEIRQEALRVLKPGGYLLAFAGTRTQHRMAVRIEDAGFEIRDMIAWVYGSGFPKSLNIGKAVDKLQGNEREEADYIAPDGKKRWGGNSFSVGEEPDGRGINKATRGTSEWEGWGTALKPALEPITVARKPLSEKTVAENCLKWGTGGINIDGCRVEYKSKDDMEIRKNLKRDSSKSPTFKNINRYSQPVESGRFPANLIHDGSDEVVGLFPNDNQRFFYCAKASKSERNRGCEELEEKANFKMRKSNGEDDKCGEKFNTEPSKNNHPTVKPIALMEYLVKLVSKEGAIVLDPFSGSGSTLIACKKLDRQYIGCEMSEDYIKIAEARLNATVKEEIQEDIQKPLF